MSKIIEHSANNRHFLIVEVPKDASDFRIIHGGTRLAWFNPHYNKIGDLPPNNYRIMFIAEQATPEQARIVVQEFHGDTRLWYRDYRFSYQIGNDPLHSLTSLIRANFTDTTKHHLILEKI